MVLSSALISGITLKLVKSSAVAAVLTLSAVGLAAPAHAYSPISVYSPDGDEYQSDAEIVVSGYNGGDGSEQLYVYCDDSNGTVEPFVSAGEFSVSIGSFTGPDRCVIEDYYSGDELATFTVDSPPTAVRDASVDTATFYPLVRDGYRDSVTFRWRQNGDGRATITVVNSDGKVIRSAAPSARSGRNTWNWNGKDNGGNLVSKGRHRIKVTVDSNTVSATVRVKTRLLIQKFRQRKEGNQGVRFATRGDCYAQRDSYNQIATLDCWGGRYAKASYRLTIPAGAFDVRGTVDLMPSDADICCKGRITKEWSRTSRRTVTLWAKVTNWRATDVNYVRVTYRDKVRI